MRFRKIACKSKGARLALLALPARENAHGRWKGYDEVTRECFPPDLRLWIDETNLDSGLFVLTAY